MQDRAPQEVTLQNIQRTLAFIGDLNRLEAQGKITREENVALNFAMLPSYVGGLPDSLTDSGLLCKTLMLSAQYNLPVLCYKTLKLMENVETKIPDRIPQHFMTALSSLTTAQHPQELPHIKTTGHTIISPEIHVTPLIIDQLLVYLNDATQLNNITHLVQYAISHKNQSPEAFHNIFLSLNLIQEHTQTFDDTGYKEKISTLIETMSKATLPLPDIPRNSSLFTPSSDTDSVSSNTTKTTHEDEDDDEKDPPHP